MSKDVCPVGVSKPKTMLVLHMTRGEWNPAEELYKYFGRFEVLVIDVDGEKHEYDADTLIALLESYESCGQVPEERTCHVEHMPKNKELRMAPWIECSECGGELPVLITANYCPNCGAKVVGE